MTKHCAIIVALGLALLVGMPRLAPAASEEEYQFLQEILLGSMDTQPENARETYGKCRALAATLKTKTHFDALQRIYMEAELERCFAYAKNNGGFSDELGDACTHHLALATKLADVIARAKENSVVTPEVMGELARGLDSAITMGPQLGCKADYEAFRPAVALAEQEAAKPPPTLDEDMLTAIGEITNSVTPENAAERLKQCDDLLAPLASKSDVEKSERAYFEGWVSNCKVNVIEIGQLSAAPGEKCTHHYAYASKLAEAVALAREEPAFAALFLPMFQAELMMAKDAAPGMGCTQDYGALKAE